MRKTELGARPDSLLHLSLIEDRKHDSRVMFPVLNQSEALPLVRNELRGGPM
jgi:hypothetical protein